MISPPVILFPSYLLLLFSSATFVISSISASSEIPFAISHHLIVRPCDLKPWKFILFVIVFRTTAERAPPGPQWSGNPVAYAVDCVPETTSAVNSELPEAFLCHESGSPFRESSFTTARLDRLPGWKQFSTPWFHWARAFSITPAGFLVIPWAYFWKSEGSLTLFSPRGASVRDAQKPVARMPNFFSSASS